MTRVMPGFFSANCNTIVTHARSLRGARRLSLLHLPDQSHQRVRHKVNQAFKHLGFTERGRFRASGSFGFSKGKLATSDMAECL